LYDYGARFYDPALGRFLSADTVVPEPGNPQALNRYSYVLNNPLGHTDPTGYLPESSVQGEPSRKKDKYAPFFQEYPYARELYKQILKLESEGITPYAEGEEWVERQYSSREEFQRNDKRLMLGSAQREFAALWNKYGVISADDPDDVPKDIYDAALTTIPFVAAGPLAGAVGKITSPNGRTGGPAHQAVIGQIETDIISRGYKPKGEFYVETPGGFKDTRFVDVAALDPSGRPVGFYQVGDLKVNGFPVAREWQAILDILRHGNYPDVPLWFYPK